MLPRSTFLSVITAAGGSALLPAREAASAAQAVPQVQPAAFDRSAFEARIRAPFSHRQAFGSATVSDGALFGFIANSLDAYEHGFGEGPGTLHAAAVLYRTAVVMALDDAAWRSLGIAERVRAAGDRTLPAADGGNPYLRTARGRGIIDLQARNVSLFICNNALEDFARRASLTAAALRPNLIPGAFVVPAGVAAINALQEERFTLFVATV